MSWGDWGFIDTPEVQHRLAMAWEDWKDKIEQHQPQKSFGLNEIAREWPNAPMYFIRHPESENDPESYNWSKSIGAFSGLAYDPDWTTGRGKPAVRVKFIGTHPDHRNDGVAEALMRRLHQDYPNHQISTGTMTDNGWDFKERMLQKEPRARDLVTAQRLAALNNSLVDRLRGEFHDWWFSSQQSRTARRLFLAMAWEDWKDKIQGGCKDGCISPFHTHGRYILPEAGAFLNYSHRANNLFISDIYTHPQNRNDGVAEALMRRLTEDHPGVPIDPGYMTPDGQKFHDRMLEKDPSARDLVTAAVRLLHALEKSEL